MALKPTTGHINPDSERATWWREVYGSLDVPLISPVPELGRFPDDDGNEAVKQFYKVDLDKLTDEQIQHTAEIASKKFDIPVDEILNDIRTTGIPILADDVSVSFDARLIL